MSLLQAFNNQLIRFLEELTTTFPEIPDFRRSLNVVETMVDVTPRLFVDQFMLHMSPYYEGIINKNEDMFLNMDIKKTYDKHSTITDQRLQGTSTDDVNIMILFQLRNIWAKNLKDINKKAIWRNLNILLKLGSLLDKTGEYQHIINYLNAVATSK